MKNSEQQIEAEIVAKGLTAPRVTPDMVDAEIISEDYVVFPKTNLTVCCLLLQNGFTVTGESACASPENFDPEIGRKIARENARNKIWPLLGFRLKDQLLGQNLTVISEEDKASLDDIWNESIANFAHEINRAYCEAIGDTSQPSWIDAPEWQKASAINGVKFHLDNPNSKPEDSHENWMAQKLAEGWVYGETKDPELKTHPCIRPYWELPQHQRVKDHLFIAVVNGFRNEF